MIEPKHVFSKIQFELAAAIKDADGKLHIDDALIVAGTPCVLVDYTNESNSSLKYIARAMRQFFRRNPRYNRFTKDAVREGLRQDWLPGLEDEEKRMMLIDFKMILGVDDNGYVLYDSDWVTKLTKNEHPDRDTYGTQVYTQTNLNGNMMLLREMKEMETHFHESMEDGYEGVVLDISSDEWYLIIKETSPLIKEYLACYIQMPEGFGGCDDVEKMFGISGSSINARNTALGKRAQKMLGIEVFQDETKNDNRRYWSTPMLKGKWSDNYFQWQMRPELIEAAKRLAKEERWDLPKRIL